MKKKTKKAKQKIDKILQKQFKQALAELPVRQFKSIKNGLKNVLIFLKKN